MNINNSDEDYDLSDKNIIGQVFHYSIRTPITILLKLTIPPPSEKLWERSFAAFSPIGAALFITFCYDRTLCMDFKIFSMDC